MLTGDSEPDLMSDMSLPQQVQMREIMESPAYTGRISAMSRLFGGRNLPGVYSPRYDGFTLALRLYNVYIPFVLKDAVAFSTTSGWFIVQYSVQR